MSVSITIQGPREHGGERAVLDASPQDTVGALLTRCAGELGVRSFALPTGRHEWIASTADGEWYTQAPWTCTTTVGAVLQSRPADASALELHVYVTDLCMHGSPGVLGKGHLCGWC